VVAGIPRSDPVRLSNTEIDFLLDEDVRFGDLTMRALGIGDTLGRMTFTARQELILCGADEACRLLARFGASATFAAQAGTRSSKGRFCLRRRGAGRGASCWLEGRPNTHGMGIRYCDADR
jgi:molybdenum transport protein